MKITAQKLWGLGMVMMITGQLLGLLTSQTFITLGDIVIMTVLLGIAFKVDEKK